jgi:hypothetical protein
MGGPREILGEGLPLPPSMGLPLPPSKGLPPPCSAASAPSLLLLPPAGRRRPPLASRAAVPGCWPPAHPALRALRPPAVRPPCSARHGGASGLPPALLGVVAPPWLPAPLLDCSCCRLPPCSVAQLLRVVLLCWPLLQCCRSPLVYPPLRPVCRGVGRQPPCPPGQWRLPARPAPLLPWLQCFVRLCRVLCLLIKFDLSWLNLFVI